MKFGTLFDVRSMIGALGIGLAMSAAGKYLACLVCMLPAILVSFPIYGGPMTVTPERVTPARVALVVVANVVVWAGLAYPLVLGLRAWGRNLRNER